MVSRRECGTRGYNYATTSEILYERCADRTERFRSKDFSTFHTETNTTRGPFRIRNQAGWTFFLFNSLEKSDGLRNDTETVRICFVLSIPSSKTLATFYRCALELWTIKTIFDPSISRCRRYRLKKLY